ncbi:MAG: PspC domain-containing protein [Acidimicrobiia bacterium]
MTTPTTTSPRPRLERPPGRILAGVAAGIARTYDVGVGWVRLGFVISAFFGFGIMLYLLGWLVIPDEGEQESLAARYLGRLDGASRWVGTGLIGLAVIILLAATGIIRSELVWAGALLLVGILLYRGELSVPQREPSAAAVPPPSGEASSGDEETAPSDRPRPEGGEGDATTVVPGASTAEPFHWGPPRPPSNLGRVTIAAILITIGVMALLDNLEVARPRSVHYAGAVIGLVGLGLLLGAWFGRSRGLIALGVVALPFVGFFALIDIPFSADWGEVVHRPTSVFDVQDEYRHAGGEFTLDLTSLDVGLLPLFIDVQVGVGEVNVIVPRGVGTSVSAEVRAGRLEVFGAVEEGLFLDESAERRGVGFIDLDVDLGAGDLSVVRTGN